MRLKGDSHLGYCTNIHRGETWAETLAGLEDFTLKVKKRVCLDDEPYGVGLRLSQRAAQELADPVERDQFKRWLDKNNCYLFTINGFPYGSFHGKRVKEQVYAPDWTSQERVNYTNLLFDLLVDLLPEEAEGSVSTLPGSFKEFITDDAEQGTVIIENLRRTCERIEDLKERTGRDLHLGLEPEPLGWFETSVETVSFFERFREQCGNRFDEILGVNYDTCHLAVEFESAGEAIGRLRDAGIRLSKIHLSSALTLPPTPPMLETLRSYEEDVYLHQVVIQDSGGDPLRRFRDLPEAFEALLGRGEGGLGSEWRVHFHVPLHARPGGGFGDTREHLLDTLDILAVDPGLCRHLEMETYTWEVLPSELRAADVTEQLEKEYDWVMGALTERGLR